MKEAIRLAAKKPMMNFGNLFHISPAPTFSPAFFHSFRKDGLRFTLLALLLVLVAVGCVFAIQAATGSDLPSLVGSMTGAVTNTPGLGTAQQTYYDTVHGTFLAEVHQPVVSSRIANAFAVALFFVLKYWKRVKRQWPLLLLIVWALATSYSRAYLGKHYPGDLVCGAILGVVAGLLVWMIINTIEKSFRKPKQNA